MTVRVLVVEDEKLAGEAHAAYTRRVEGFEVAGVVRSAGETMRHLAADPQVDLILLDMHLPDSHGLALLQRLRAEGHLCDVIAVTSARDAEVVRQAVARGVVLYLLKPFSFRTFRDKLEQYAAYREQLAGTTEDVLQHEVDQLFGTLRQSGRTDLPKGMSDASMRQVTEVLREAEGGLSASEVAVAMGASRVTARRYLEHLADQGLAERSQRYGGGGRPEVGYLWVR